MVPRPLCVDARFAGAPFTARVIAAIALHSHQLFLREC
jgi:hypothetical protein